MPAGSIAPVKRLWHSQSDGFHAKVFNREIIFGFAMCHGIIAVATERVEVCRADLESGPSGEPLKMVAIVV